jgi:gamma-glutamylcyclotransferase (GGCT)/AIG2-like uncharacterized protein YtfP
MDCYVFAYGTLLDAKVRNDILGYSTSICNSKIQGFHMKKIRLGGRIYPILVEDHGSEIWIEGGYFKINPKDLKRLDDYESPAYRRKLVKTAEGVPVWIYYR